MHTLEDRVAALEVAMSRRTPVRDYSNRNPSFNAVGTVRVPATHQDKFAYLLSLSHGGVPGLLARMIDAAYAGVIEANAKQER